MAEDTARTVDDTQSRLWLQTKTTTLQHWDQVIGVSQRVINAQFEHLYDLYPEMNEIYSSVDDAGTFNATLLPPKVLIPGSDDRTTELLFVLRFENGYMQNSNDKVIISDMSDWQLASPVTIATDKVDIKDDMLEGEKNEAKRNNEWVDRFDVPGDYSIERMYAKLSSIRWYQVDKDYSTCGLDKDNKPIPYHKWSSENRDADFLLSLFLKQWSEDQDNLGRNNIGIQVQPHPPKDENQATYAPICVMNQTYPYKSAPQGFPDGVTGDEGGALCNAYLYTEMVRLPGRDNNKRPDDAKLVWSGNFCTMTTPANPSPPDGTFVVGHNVFLETFILPQLKPLVQAVDIHHDQPYGAQAWHGRIVAQTPITVGEFGSGSTAYDFVSINQLDDPNIPSGYRLTKQSGPIEVEVASSNLYGDLKMIVQDVMTIDVSWVAGEPTIKVKGTMTNSETCKWQLHKARKDYAGWSNIWAFLEDNYSTSFEITLRLTSTNGLNENGVIHVEVDSHDVDFDVTPQMNHQHVTYDGQEKNIRRQLQRSSNGVLSTVVASLQERLNMAGGFIFPGNGVFSFSNPRMSKFGNLLADIQYKPLQKDQKYVCPRPPKKESKTGDGDKPPENKEGPINDSTEDKWRLNWVLNPSTAAAANLRNKVVLRGTNPSNELTCRFKAIDCQFLSGARGKNLFTETKWSTTAGGDGGTVTLRQSLEHSRDSAEIAQCTVLGGNQLLTTMDTAKNNDGKLRVGPGDWIEIEWEGVMGAPGSYPINVAEKWADGTGRSFHRQALNFKVDAASLE